MQTFIGKHRSTIKQLLGEKQLAYVEFCHWLYVPKLQLLLSFHQQNCQEAKSILAQMTG